MKIIIIGANGQLGNDIIGVLKETQTYEVIGLTHSDIEITNIDCVRNIFRQLKPEIIVNTAALSDVLECEKNPRKAFSVNSIGTKNIADISLTINSLIIHISTDYVFDGLKNEPYLEKDCPNPLNVYGNSKLSGEYFVNSINKKYYIIRVSGIYGHQPCRSKDGINFVKAMLKQAKEKEKVRVVEDEILSPTYTIEIARQINKLIEVRPEYGIYHSTAEGECSWFDFAKEIFNIAKLDVKLEKATPGEFSNGIKRPKYSVLENHNLKKNRINIISHWKKGLKEYMG